MIDGVIVGVTVGVMVGVIVGVTDGVAVELVTDADDVLMLAAGSSVFEPDNGLTVSVYEWPW